MKLVAIALGFVALAVAGVDPAFAQNFPNRSLTLIVPFGPGSVSDTQARIVAKVLTEKFGQNVVIDNKLGAGGIVASEALIAAKPDGYTVMYGATGALAVFPSLHKKLSYNTLRDMTPVHGWGETPLYFTVSGTKPYKTWAQFEEYAKKNPGKLNYGSYGTGTTSHLVVELLEKASGMKFTHVPYRSIANMMADLLGGQIDFVVSPYVDVSEHAKAGKLWLIAASGAIKSKVEPNLPSLADLGYADAATTSWGALMAPAGTPEPIIKKWAEALSASLKDPAYITYLDTNGSNAWPDVGPQKIGEHIAKETERYRAIIQEAGITVD